MSRIPDSKRGETVPGAPPSRDTGSTKPGGDSRIPDRKDSPTQKDRVPNGPVSDRAGNDTSKRGEIPQMPGDKSRVPTGSVFERDRKAPSEGGVVPESRRTPSDRTTPGRETGGITGRREPGSRVEPGASKSQRPVPSDRIVERPSRKDLPTTAAMREVPPRPKKQWAPPAYHGHHDRDDRHWRNDRWRNDRWRDDYWHDYWHDYYRHRPRWGFSTYLGFGSWGFFSHYGRYHALSFWCGAPAYPPVVYASPAVTYNYYYGWPYSTNYTYFYGGPYAYTSYRPLYRTVTYYEPSYYSVDYYSAPWYEGVYYEPTPWFYGPAYSGFSLDFTYIDD